MKDDSIVEEVRRIREELLAEYGGDLPRLIADAQRRTEQAVRGGRQLFPSRQARAPEPHGTRKVG
jgi:hypothetical protein